MILRQDVSEGVHALMDYIQDKGTDRNLYYKINHVSAKEIDKLTSAVIVWLNDIGIAAIS